MTQENTPAEQTLWGGRFEEALAESALNFSASIGVDGRMYREDIAGSIAHVQMLAAVGVISPAEAEAIAEGLKAIREEIEGGTFVLGPGHEDVHLAIEARLIEKIGPVGGKLHTGRSRNDQVALDERLHFRSGVAGIVEALVGLQRAVVEKAGAYRDTIMPGYTHMQRAQPILLAHHLLAYVEMLERDKERLFDCLGRMNRSPLGAAALAGTSYPLDRAATAKSLGFERLLYNSIDAVSDRDYLIEFVSACSIIMMHLSRFAEEIVLWTTREFGFARVGDAYATGSSIMPQKKNPDMAELVRGKTGRVYGDLITLLTIMKGLPLAYNRDLQEDKEPAFDALDTVSASLGIFAAMIASTTFDSDRMAEALRHDFPTATELADYLVRTGIPFREAHAITGAIVAHCVRHDQELSDLDLPTLQSFSAAIGPDVFQYLSPQSSIERKQTIGSTAPEQVHQRLEWWGARLGPKPPIS